MMHIAAAEIDALITRMGTDLEDYLAQRGRSDYAMIGIHTGGVWIAERLYRRLAPGDPLGQLNIAFYRDDFSRIGMHPSVEPSALPFEIEDRHIVLVDDVLYTGRTIRAALNEIFDYGRPASITLAVLLDRGEHELPIQADIVGRRVSLPAGEHVKLTGPDPLGVTTKTAA